VKKGRFEVKCEPGFGNIMAIQEAKGGVVWVIKAGEVDWRSELIDCINEPRVIKKQEDSLPSFEVCGDRWYVIPPNIGWNIVEMFELGGSKSSHGRSA
jgi:hypothetical protein